MTVEAENGAVILARPPQRIVSLSPSATEILFAIGAGARVVAVDESSTYPPSAPQAELSYANPDPQAIVRHRPDLVVVEIASQGVVPVLERMEIPTLVYRPAHNLTEAYRQILHLGVATSQLERAQDVVTQMKERVEGILDRVDDERQELSVYHEIHPNHSSGTSATLAGSIYDSLGLHNIADDAAEDGAYPQLSSGYVAETDPDLIVLARPACCGHAPSAFKQRPGMKDLTAVRNGDVVAVSDAVASRWGPRIVDFMETVADRVKVMQDRG